MRQSICMVKTCVSRGKRHASWASCRFACLLLLCCMSTTAVLHVYYCCVAFCGTMHADLQDDLDAMGMQLLDHMLQLLRGSSRVTAHSKGWIGGKEGHWGLPHRSIPLCCHHHWRQQHCCCAHLPEAMMTPLLPYTKQISWSAAGSADLWMQKPITCFAVFGTLCLACGEAQPNQPN